jgi:hypothetical protein
MLQKKNVNNSTHKSLNLSGSLWVSKRYQNKTGRIRDKGTGAEIRSRRAGVRGGGNTSLDRTTQSGASWFVFLDK